MSARFLIPLALLLVLSASLPATGDGTVIGVYTVRFADPEETARLLTALITPAGKAETPAVQSTGRQLVVRASAAQHIEIEAVLRDLDRPPRNVRIEVHIDRKEDRSAREASIRPRGPVVVDRDGVRIPLGGRLQHQDTQSTERVVQHLVVMDGGRASLRVGESVPWLRWIEEYSFRHGYIRTHRIEWVDIGSFLSIEPEVLGDGWIRVRIVPTLSGRDGSGARQSIRFTEVATEVIARDGQTIRLGGFSQDEEFHSRFLVGRSGGHDQIVTDLTLTPTLIDP